MRLINRPTVLACAMVLAASLGAACTTPSPPPEEPTLNTEGKLGNTKPAGGTVVASPAPTSSKPEYRIVDAGKLYSTINQTDCLRWPSADIKRRAGENFWGSSFYPKAGDVGALVGTTNHCDSGIEVYILKIGENYAAIGADGVQLIR